MTAVAAETNQKPPRAKKAKAKRKTASKRRVPRRAGSKTPPAPLTTLPVNLTKFRPGQDYQVAAPRLINGRKYKEGEILDQTGIATRDIEVWRDLRHIIDIPASGPLIPIPEEATPAPLSAEERGHMVKRADKPEGRVTPKHRGFGKWYAMDGSGKNVAGPFEGDHARVLAMRKCVELNDENEHPVTDEERAEAAIVFNDKEPHGR